MNSQPRRIEGKTHINQFFRNLEHAWVAGISHADWDGYQRLSVLWNCCDIDSIPPTVTVGETIFNFNLPVSVVASNLTTLILNESFNQAVDQLPAGLTHLDIRENFNQPVDQLPSPLESLKLDWRFNWPIDHLPRSLTSLR